MDEVGKMGKMITFLYLQNPDETQNNKPKRKENIEHKHSVNLRIHI